MTDAIRSDYPRETLTRVERDRRSRYIEARTRGLRNFETHPLEPWEAPLSNSERLALEAKRNKRANSITLLSVAREDCPDRTKGVVEQRATSGAEQ